MAGGTKSRDISSGDRHGATDLGREKTKRLGNLSATAFSSDLFTFLFLVAGIARIISPCLHITLFRLTLAQPRSGTTPGSWAFRFFLLFALMEENRTHLCNSCRQCFRIVLLLLLLITYITARATSTSHMHSTETLNSCIYLFSTTCSRVKGGGDWVVRGV